MKRVVWTDEEWETVFAGMARARINEPRARLGRLFLKAQEPLPPQRRRTMPAGLKYTIPMEAEVQKRVEKLSQSTPVTAVAQPPSTSQPTAVQLLDEMPFADLTAYYEFRGGKEKEQSVQQFTFEELAYTTPLADLARVYQQRLQEQMDTFLQITRETQMGVRRLTEFVRGATGAGQPLNDHTRDTLPLIVVVGLIKDESVKVVARFDNLARFVFFEKDRAPSDLSNLEQSADCFVFMAKYLTSKWRAVFGTHPKARFVEGSLLGLYDQLTVLINKLAKK